MDPLVRCDEHHIPAVFMFEAGVINTINVDRVVYNKANVQGIVNTFNTANWPVTLKAATFDDCVSEF